LAARRSLWTCPLNRLAQYHCVSANGDHAQRCEFRIMRKSGHCSRYLQQIWPFSANHCNRMRIKNHHPLYSALFPLTSQRSVSTQLGSARLRSRVCRAKTEVQKHVCFRLSPRPAASIIRTADAAESAPQSGAGPPRLGTG